MTNIRSVILAFAPDLGGECPGELDRKKLKEILGVSRQTVCAVLATGKMSDALVRKISEHAQVSFSEVRQAIPKMSKSRRGAYANAKYYVNEASRETRDALLKQAGLDDDASLREIAEALNVPPSTVKLWVKNASRPASKKTKIDRASVKL